MSEARLVVDTREKKPYRFAGIDDVIRKPLETGDYTHEGFEDVYAVERKSLDDLATSLGTDRDRFEAEIQRANESFEEFVVVIEAPKRAVYDYRNHKSCPNYFSDIYPKSIVSTVEAWPNRYEPLRFEWAGSREEAKQETLRLLDKWYVKHGTSLG